jgi:mono/diheme cytochrome c family protein
MFQQLIADAGLAVMERKRFILLLSIAVAALGLCAVALTVVDMTNEAEPSRAETWLAWSLFRMKIRAQKPRHPVHLTTTEEDLDRASVMYQQMCSFCHGATRGRVAPFARSLSPRPPQFVIHPSERPTWTDAYVIQHGIRWTGMPSFQTLSDADVWHLALYVEGQSKPRE